MTLSPRSLIGLADRRHRVALAGAGLAVDDREPLGAGGVAERPSLFARDSVELFRAENFRAHALADVVPLVAGQAVGWREARAARPRVRSWSCSG